MYQSDIITFTQDIWPISHMDGLISCMGARCDKMRYWTGIKGGLLTSCIQVTQRKQKAKAVNMTQSSPVVYTMLLCLAGGVLSMPFEPTTTDNPCSCTTSELYGGEQGDGFVDIGTNPCDVEITDIRIRHGGIVDSIQVQYNLSDGHLQMMSLRGGATGKLSRVSVPQGGKIIGVTGGIMNWTPAHYGPVITQLRILVLDAENNLQVYGPFGRHLDNSLGTFAVYGDIKSVFGNHGRYLNGLGVYYEPWGACGGPCAVN